MSDKRGKKHLTLVFLSHPERPLQDSDVKSIKFARSEKGNHDGELFLFLFGIEHFSHLKLRSGVLKDGNHIEPPAKFFGNIRIISLIDSFQRNALRSLVTMALQRPCTLFFYKLAMLVNFKKIPLLAFFFDFLFFRNTISPNS